MGLTNTIQARNNDNDRRSLGNLGSTLLKRSYLFLEIVLQFLALTDLFTRLEARWAIRIDRPYIISILSLSGTATLLNIILIFVLAFNNINIPPSRKIWIRTWRPILQFILIFPCGILIQHNNIYILFSTANIVFWTLSGVHLHVFLKESFIEMLSKCIPGVTDYKSADEVPEYVY